MWDVDVGSCERESKLVYGSCERMIGGGPANDGENIPPCTFSRVTPMKFACSETFKILDLIALREDEGADSRVMCSRPLHPRFEPLCRLFALTEGWGKRHRRNEQLETSQQSDFSIDLEELETVPLIIAVVLAATPCFQRGSS